MHSSFNLIASTGQVVTHTLKDSWAWYLIRASGLAALTLLVLLMTSGIGHVTGWTYKLMAPVKAWAVHKAMAILLAVSVTLHLAGLLVDHYVRFSLLQEFIPFLKNYTNGTTLFGLDVTYLAIPLGILAMYGTYIVTLSSLDSVGWIRNHKKLWQVIHISSYVTIIFAIIHVLSVGTDFKESGWRLLAIVTLVVLVIATIARLLRANFLAKEPND